MKNRLAFKQQDLRIPGTDTIRHLPTSKKVKTDFRPVASLTIAIAAICICGVAMWHGGMKGPRSGQALGAMAVGFYGLFCLFWVNIVIRFFYKPHEWNVLAIQSHSLPQTTALQSVHRFFEARPLIKSPQMPSILLETWWKNASYDGNSVTAELVVVENAFQPYPAAGLGKLLRDATLKVRVTAQDDQTLRYEWDMFTYCDPMGPLIGIIDYAQRDIERYFASAQCLEALTDSLTERTATAF